MDRRVLNLWLSRTWRKLAGRGEIGNENWGANFNQSEEEKKQWLENLRKHIGEVVLITGGGGRDFNLGVLKDARLVELGDKQVVQAKLENVTPRMAFTENGIFEPYLDSWQISALEESSEF